MCETETGGCGGLYIPEIQTLGTLRQQDWHKFEASLAYIVPVQSGLG